MDELIQRFNENAVRYLVFGGQAVRLEGMPRFSMDWDLFIPGKDASNMERINELLVDELDMPLLPIGPRGKNLFVGGSYCIKRGRRPSAGFGRC
jgi:hypothetical protein